MTCRYFIDISTYLRNLSMGSTGVEFVSIFRSIFDILSRSVGRFDQSARLREQLDSQFAESTELETQIKANLEGLGL